MVLVRKHPILRVIVFDTITSVNAGEKPAPLYMHAMLPPATMQCTQLPDVQTRTKPTIHQTSLQTKKVQLINKIENNSKFVHKSVVNNSTLVSSVDTVGINNFVPNKNFNSSNLPTPIKPYRLEVYLNGYNNWLKNYLLSGFTKGFRLDNIKFTAYDNDKTLNSARILPNKIKEKLDKEISLGRIVGPFDSSPLENLVVSPLGLVEKKVRGEYRVIHHLSFPSGSSINDGIPRESATVKYASIQDAIEKILLVGSHCYMAKSDIKSAFRIIPIHPDDHHLLGMKWHGQYYYDRCLPMGASSSCAIFEKFSTALQWITEKLIKDCYVVHVLDDFLFIGETYQQCQLALKTFLFICEDIGVPIAPEKKFFPSMIMQFLGIDLDTINMQFSIPSDKV